MIPWADAMDAKWGNCSAVTRVCWMEKLKVELLDSQVAGEKVGVTVGLLVELKDDWQGLNWAVQTVAAKAGCWDDQLVWLLADVMAA